MVESQTVRPQGDWTVIFRNAILPVTYQWQSSAGKLRTDLMGAAGMELNANAG